MKIKIDVRKSLYDQEWWPKLNSSQRLQAKKTWEDQTYLIEAIKTATKKRFPFLYEEKTKPKEQQKQ